MRLHGRLDRLTLHSRVLADNPLGDPCERELFVYVPAGYRQDRRYASVTLLAGYGSTNHSLIGYDAFSPNVIERYDRLVHTGQAPEALIVLPDAMNRWGGSQFLDSPASGRYQEYLAEEVVEFVDRHYRTIPERTGRAIVGRSSGGFGALRMGLDRPDRFAVIGSHAGDCAFDISILPELRAAAIAYDLQGGFSAFAQAFTDDPNARNFTAIMILAYAAAYAPEPDTPLPMCRVPIDSRTGSLDEVAWRQWLAHDPVVRTEHDESAFADASLVFLDAGDRDEHGLQFGARRLAALLSARGANVVHEEFEGGHRGTGHRYEVSLPRLIAACG